MDKPVSKIRQLLSAILLQAWEPDIDKEIWVQISDSEGMERGRLKARSIAHASRIRQREEARTSRMSAAELDRYFIDRGWQKS